RIFEITLKDELGTTNVVELLPSQVSLRALDVDDPVQVLELLHDGMRAGQSLDVKAILAGDDDVFIPSGALKQLLQGVAKLGLQFLELVGPILLLVVLPEAADIAGELV